MNHLLSLYERFYQQKKKWKNSGIEFVPFLVFLYTDSNCWLSSVAILDFHFQCHAVLLNLTCFNWRSQSL